jgi:fatty acid desaturase
MNPTGKPTWQTPVVYFVLFNLLGAPLIGRGVWLLMQEMNAGGGRIIAVALSLAAAIGILAVNAMISIWSGREGLPRRGQRILWLITGGTFVLTIGFGTFSPVNLVIAMIRAG